MEAVMGLGILVGIIIFVLLALRASDKRQHHLPGEGIAVEHSPAEAIEMLTRHLVAQGYAVTQRSDYTAALTRRKKPDYMMTIGFAVVGVVLFPVGLLLLGAYLLYFPVVKPKATVSIVASPEANGTRLALSGDDRSVRKDLKRWADESAVPQTV